MTNIPELTDDEATVMRFLTISQTDRFTAAVPKIDSIADDDDVSLAALAAYDAKKRAEIATPIYQERDRLVAALSKVYPSYLKLHPADEPWDDDWRTIVFIDLPTGQASWHIHDSEVKLFTHLLWGGAEWDGHTTEEKYRRVDALPGGQRSAIRVEAMRECKEDAFAVAGPAGDDDDDTAYRAALTIADNIARRIAKEPTNGQS